MRKSATLIVLFLVAAMILTACGGADTPAATTRSPAASTSSAAAVSSTSAVSASAAPDSDAATTAAGPDGGELTYDEFGMTPPGVYPITGELTTLTVFTTQHLAVEDMFTNAATLWLEDKTNIHADWIIATPAEGAEKISLMMASGTELPDCFLTRQLSREQVSVYGAEGSIIPLNGLIEKYGYYTNKIQEFEDQYINMISSPDGNIYATYEYSVCYHCMMPQKAWVNQNWMDNLGAEMPTTTDEFYELMLRFKNEDANGNGDPNDEIPLSATTNNTAAQMDGYFMNPFVKTTSGNYLYVEDDTVKFSPTEEGWREGLRWQRKLFEDGLLDAEAFVNESTQLVVLMSDPAGNRIGAFPGQAVDRGSAETRGNYVALEPLEGPTGIKQTISNYFGNVGGTSPCFMISADCETPEIAFRWADTFAVDFVGELEAGNYDWMNFRFGPEDGFWRRATEGEVGLDGSGTAYYKWILPWGEKQNYHWMDIQSHYSRMENKGYIVWDPSSFDQEAVLWQATQNLYEPYRVAASLPVINFDRDDAAERAVINTDMLDYVKQCHAQFVTGAMDIETDWDRYVAEFDVIGVPRLLEITQNGFDRMYK